MQELLPKVDSVIVIGAGFIGLETAQALRELGKRVTLVESLDWVLPQMLDYDMSVPVRDLLTDHGIQVLLGQEVEAINWRKRVKAVTVGGTKYPGQMVVLATGVRPRSNLARDGGVEVKDGVVVDQTMRTSDPDIFAAGDVVEAKDMLDNQVVLANWPNATNGGRIAGFNMAGVAARSTGTEALNVVRLFDVPVCSIGDVTAGESFTVKKKGVWKRYHLTDDRITGMQWVGSVDMAGVVLSMMKKRENARNLIPILEKDTLSYPQLLAQSGLLQTSSTP